MEMDHAKWLKSACLEHAVPTDCWRAFCHLSTHPSHGFIEIDNNLAENAIRPFALGRRNRLLIVSEKGVQASATIYSILITAKANDIEPISYPADMSPANCRSAKQPKISKPYCLLDKFATRRDMAYDWSRS